MQLQRCLEGWQLLRGFVRQLRQGLRRLLQLLPRREGRAQPTAHAAAAHAAAAHATTAHVTASTAAHATTAHVTASTATLSGCAALPARIGPIAFTNTAAPITAAPIAATTTAIAVAAGGEAQLDSRG